MFSSVQWRKRCTDFALYSHLPCQQQKSFVSLFIISLMLLILEHCVHFKIPQPKKDKKNKEMENSFFLRKGVIQLFPAFMKFALHHFTLMKDRHQYLFSLTKRKSCFCEEGETENRVWGLFCCAESSWRQHTPHHHESRCRTPPLGTMGSISASSCHSFEMCFWALVLFFFFF